MPLKFSLTRYLFKVVMLLWRKIVQRKLVIVERNSLKKKFCGRNADYTDLTYA